jgi:hypothetical protein
MLQYSVHEGDVTLVPSDVLLMEYAGYHSVPGGQVAAKLESSGLIKWEETCPGGGQCRLVATAGTLPQKHVLFIGTPPPEEFGYGEMYRFALRAVEALAKSGVTATKVTAMLPRGSTGLDHGESLQNLIRGFEDGCRSWPQARIKHVEFVERNSRRAAFLASLLARDFEERRSDDTLIEEGSEDTIVTPLPTPTTASQGSRGPSLGGALEPARPKQHVFVAMPFSEQFEDVYELGIYPALRDAGFICERLDRAAFTGDILERMKDRIRSASFVLADLSEARPNVYLEVGYAWGKGVPVLFIARDGETLHFDVKTHRCLFYTSIRHLKRDLEQAARGLA